MTREIWVADSETDPFKAGRVPAPFIWGAYNGSEYHEFTDTLAFLEFITARECIVYAHNGGKFDWHFIIDELEEFSSLMVISGRLAKFQIGEAEFRDSYNILPMPLSAWEKDDFDYTILEAEVRHEPPNWRKIQDYLRNDCVYLYQMVSEYIERYGVNLTQAGTAMKVWQKLCQVKAPKTNAMFYDTIAPFYYGGRVECFETGIIEHDFKVIDINSAYPFAMKHLHPYGDTYNVTTSLPKSREYTQRAFITLSCVSRGALPFRGKTGLSFPSDDIVRTYTITGWEFLAAIETGTIEDWEILEVITFNDSIRFDDYIDHFYKMKDDAKARGYDNETHTWKCDKSKTDYTFAKLFLNSLYGKLGANPENYNEYTIVKPRYIEGAEADGYNFCTEMGPWALCSKPLDETQARYYNVAVAASITGFVRAYLWRAIVECKGVMYCDTDSITCVDTGTLALDPSQLGAWDIEANCDHGGIAGKKLYAFHDSDTNKWKTASKGVRLDADQLMQVAAGKDITYHPKNPSFSLKRGIKFISRKISKSA